MNCSLFWTILLAASIVACAPSSGDTESDSADTTRTEVEDAPDPGTESTGFDELSSDYYESDTRVIWQKPELVIGHLGDLEGKTIADIGAGTGYFAFRIAAGGGNVIAIDVDERAIAWMESEKKRYPQEVQDRFETRLATPDDPMLKDAETDMILMVNTYIYIEDKVSYFRRLRDRLTPGGRIILVDFKATQTDIGPRLEDRIALHQVQQELSSAGYAILTSDDTSLEYQYIVTAAVPQ